MERNFEDIENYELNSTQFPVSSPYYYVKNVFCVTVKLYLGYIFRSQKDCKRINKYLRFEKRLFNNTKLTYIN